MTTYGTYRQGNHTEQVTARDQIHAALYRSFHQGDRSQPGFWRSKLPDHFLQAIRENITYAVQIIIYLIIKEIRLIHIACAMRRHAIFVSELLQVPMH